MLVACVQYCYRGAAEPLRYGLRLQVENFGALRYEKGGQALHGRALLQRHEASKADRDNFEGEGSQVSGCDAAIGRATKGEGCSDGCLQERVTCQVILNA